MANPTWFGDESYYQWLRQGVAGADAGVMEQFFADVYTHLRPWAVSQVGPQDADDVLSELNCRLWTHIAIYLTQSGDYSPIQRQAWLKTLAQRALYDYLDQNTFGQSYRTRKTHREQGMEEAAVQQTSLEAWQEQGGDLAAPLQPEDMLQVGDENPQLNHIITQACNLRIGPAEILTFLYHCVVFYLEGDSLKKGHPEQTQRRLAGKTLGTLRRELPGALENASGYGVNSAVFAVLDQKLQGHTEDVYTFNAAKISASSSYSKRRIAGEGKRRQVYND